MIAKYDSKETENAEHEREIAVLESWNCAL